MGNNLQKKIVEYQNSSVPQHQFFYNPLVQKNDFDRLSQYQECTLAMLKGYEQHSKLEQAIVIFESVGTVKTICYGAGGRLLSNFKLTHRLNVGFARDSKYQTVFRKKYGVGLILPDLYLLEIKHKEANCVEAAVLLANLFRAAGIDCYFKINYFDSHVCLVADIGDKFYNFHFQDIGNTMSKEEGFNPEKATDEKMLFFWNMVCGKVLSIQGKLEQAIQLYDYVQYNVEQKLELSESLNYLRDNRIISLIQNRRYEQALTESNEYLKTYTSYFNHKKTIFTKLENNLLSITHSLESNLEFTKQHQVKYLKELAEIIEVCSAEEDYYITGRGSDDALLGYASRLKVLAQEALSIIKNL